MRRQEQHIKFTKKLVKAGSLEIIDLLWKQVADGKQKLITNYVCKPDIRNVILIIQKAKKNVVHPNPVYEIHISLKYKRNTGVERNSSI